MTTGPSSKLSKPGAKDATTLSGGTGPTGQVVGDDVTMTPPAPMRYRWLLILIGLAIVVSILLVYAQNTVYQPSNPFAGGSGDHVHAFALDPQQPNHLYVGTHFGFFVSDDGGATWRRLNGQGGIAATLVATSVSISPLAGATVYATGYNLGDGSAAGVYVTLDNGLHWNHLPTGGAGQIPDPRLLFVAAGWQTAGEAYAYSIDTGLYRTLDHGTHWTNIAPPFPGQVTAFLPYLACGNQPPSGQTDCPENFLIGTTQGLWHGTDVGTRLVLTADPLVTNYVYAVTVTHTSNPKIYVSTALGLFASDTGPTGSPGSSTLHAISNVAEGALTFTSLAALNTPGGQVVYGVTRDNAVRISLDGGVHWQVTGAGQLNRDVSQLQAGLRSATGNNTPQWAGGQNIFLTLLQVPATASDHVYVAISFPVQIFNGSQSGATWHDLSHP